MRIVILGDIGASSTNYKAFCNADENLFSKEIIEQCNNADIVLLNLEKPLTNTMSPLGKCPPDYCAPTDSINGIMLLHPTVVTLANNHIMDQGEQGLNSTISILEKNSIKYVGVGCNSEKARYPLIIEQNGIRIGIYACCEKEFSFATEKTPGANTFDPLYTFDDIEVLNNNCDHLIVLFHGGMQGFPYPTPYQRRICRKMCEKGADLVVCQHSHIVGCDEEYNEAHIVYGQGNFLLDEVNDENWNTGLMIINLIKNDKWHIEYIPVQTFNHGVVIHKNPIDIMGQFQKRSFEIVDNKRLNDIYDKKCIEKLPDYLVKLAGTRIIVQKIVRRLRLNNKYSKWLYNKVARNRVLDYLYCDTHREAIICGIEKTMKKPDK